MEIQKMFETLKDEFKPGVFTLEKDTILWQYSTNSAKNYNEAEDRYLSLMGAKCTFETLINDDYEIDDIIESNHKIGFMIKRKTK